MISSEDVRRVTFDKAMRGYRCEDVDDYLKQVAESMDAMAATNDDLQKKLVVLAQRIDQYRAEEDTLRTTMINAQRLGENVIREAKQKAAEIIREAGIKAEDREQRSRDEVELAKQEIVTLKSESDSFKRSLMEMYRKHINLISKLPEYSSATDTAVSETEAAAAAKVPSLNVQPVQPARPAYQPAAPVTPAPSEQTEPAPAPFVEQSYYEEPAAQPAAEPIDTVEFAIAPHAGEPEQPGTKGKTALPDNDLQPGAGLYEAAEPAPARKPRKTATKKAAKPKQDPPEELEAPAFDNFEGVDFDS